MATLVSVIMRGLHSALPSAGIAGRLYFCSDSSGTYEGAIYYDDGTNWDGPYGGSGGGGGASFEVNGTPLSSATTVNFENGSNITITNPSAGNVEIAASGGGSLPPFLTFTTPPTSGWTFDQGSNTTPNDTSAGYPYLYGQTGGNIAIWYYRTAPSTPYTITAAFLWDGSGFDPGAGGSSGQGAIGLLFRDSTGKGVDFRTGPAVAGDIGGLTTYKWNSSNSPSGAYTTQNNTLGAGQQTFRVVWLQIGDDGTNLTFSWSVDGYHFHLFDTQSRTNWLSSGPTEVGITLQVSSAAVACALLSWAVGA